MTQEDKGRDIRCRLQALPYPGVYTPQQARSGITDDKLVEAVARAIYASYQFVKPWEHPDTVRIHHTHTTAAARAAIAAVRQHMQNDWK